MRSLGVSLCNSVANCYRSPAMDRYIEKILSARVYDVAVESPLEEAYALSRRLNNRVLLKREDLQSIFSFKLRGAYNKIWRLNREQAIEGVVASSAGNHAQGVALAAKRLGLSAVIVMPRTTPQIKVDAVKALGARAVLHGDAYDEAYAHAREIEEEKGFPFIHPFDDPDTIAGQGTVGMELCRQFGDDLHAIFVPVGGGGLIAGIAAFVKYLRPETRIIGVEPDDAASMTTSLKRGRRVRLDHVGLFADGVAVAQPGKESFRLARKYVDEMVLVSTDEICAAIKDIFGDTRTMAEPAGALGVAGMKRYIEREGLRDENMVAVVAGANINFDRLRHVAERAELGEQREVLFAATIPERPGSFRKFCQSLGKRSITEFNYRYSDDSDAHVFVGVRTNGGPDERRDIIEDLHGKGYEVKDLTDNEMAKLHVRYLVGGHVNGGINNERVLRFEFPERPGALQKFLDGMGRGWNISLFHYRNHGAAYGRVLAGMQVPKDDERRFRQFLDDLGYFWTEESDNPAYQTFLR
ncbi:MAG: threonine ammonia-lyase, biosynthetic [Halofilum sp. (in: g-proteobacteria)]